MEIVYESSLLQTYTVMSDSFINAPFCVYMEILIFRVPCGKIFKTTEYKVERYCENVCSFRNKNR